ncbi:hypothetical protein [Streptomyces sp. cf386]|uniref:hypothetical protein n=1 Tax=Streptomyces sp. cf386 TaxID=1761904 RepID=UPI002108D01B|nr:hypothetical protein [Streptomyces sp. cf386]
MPSARPAPTTPAGRPRSAATSSDYDQLIDAGVDACAKDHPSALSCLFARDDLAVPRHITG